MMREAVRNILYHLPHKMAHSLIYMKKHKCKMNWNNPTLYDEKIHWLMVYVYDTNYGRFADKYQVRQYVKECGLGDLLIPLLGVYKNVEDIDYDILPDRFILKATQGSGDELYEICADKENMDVVHVNAKMNKALQIEFFKYHCEYQYEKIVPRIMCEKLLKSENGERLNDYKVICANGRATAILVCTNRDEGRDYYSCEWEYLDYVKEECRSGEKAMRPVLLEEMIEAAEILSKPFPLARIDFYIVDQKLYFGEITLTPSAGNHLNLNKQGQQELGRVIRLPDMRM